MLCGKQPWEGDLLCRKVWGPWPELQREVKSRCIAQELK